MNQASLVFRVVSTGEVIYDPLRVQETPVEIEVTNYAEIPATNLGIYIVPALNTGGLDYPATKTPEADYQDLLTMGTRTQAGIETQGGLIVAWGEGYGESQYVTREHGSLRRNKIRVPSIPANGVFLFSVRIEPTDPAEARRFFINIVLE